MVADSGDQRAKVPRLSERALLNLIEYLDEIRVECVCAIRVRVAEVLDILREVAEEEDVVLSNLARNFNLPTGTIGG